MRSIASFASVLLLFTLTTALSAADPVKVACVGDSITIGYGLADGSQAYPGQLGRILGEGFDVRNCGVIRATYLDASDKPYKSDPMYTAVLNWKPDYIFITLGANDTKAANWRHEANFVADVKSMIAGFRGANPEVKVYICLPLPVFPEYYGITQDTISRGVIPKLRTAAEEAKVGVVDLHTPFLSSGRQFPDKLHPNAEASRRVAEIIHAAAWSEE